MLDSTDDRTLSLPGVDVSQRTGPTIAIEVTFAYGTDPRLARYAIVQATEAFNRAVAKAGAISWVVP